MGKSLKKLSLVLALALVVSMLSSLTAMADGGVWVESKNGGKVSISNVIDEIKFTDEGAMVGDTIFVSDEPVTISISGNDPHPSLSYFPQAKLDGDFFDLGSEQEEIEVVNNTIVLDKPGYYGGFVRFGSEFSASTVAQFVVQIIGEEASESADPYALKSFDLVDETTGYSISFPGYVKNQYVKTKNAELEEVIERNALVLKNPPANSERILLLELTTEVPEAKYAFISVESSNNNGQVAYADDAFVDGKLSVYKGFLDEADLKSFVGSDLLSVYIDVYDEDYNLLYTFYDIDFMYEGFTNYYSTTAKPTSSKVIVDGKEVAFDAFNINNNNNYFKLRDIAKIVNGTDKQFEVSWDSGKQVISLESGSAYTSVGGELTVSKEKKNKNAKFNSSAILLDGEEAQLEAYTIAGNNYFKLRDLAAAFDFNVTWDAAAKMIVIDTSTGYVEEE